MRIADEFEWVPQMRHFQALFARYRHAPGILKTLQERFGLRRVTDSDPSPYSTESALQMSEWLHSLGDPHAIAWIANALDLGAGDGVVYYLRSHDTLAQALDEINRLSPLFFPDAQFAYEVVDKQVHVTFLPVDTGNRLGVSLRYEAICVWLKRVVDDITGGKAQLLRMEWMDTSLPDYATLHDILPSLPKFGAARYALVYPASALESHLPGASKALRSAMASTYEKRFLGKQYGASMVRRVARWFNAQSQLNEPRLDTAAQALAKGSSTLRRQLAQEGCNFSDLLASHRAYVAMHEIIHSEEKAETVALQTGYADRNTFERAFREWFGATPAHCRRAAKELLGHQRHHDWNAPSRWSRHAPNLAWLKQQMDHVQIDWHEISVGIALDPVLHARMLGYLAMPSQGARSLTHIAAEHVAELPTYALGSIFNSATPLPSADADTTCQAVWRTGRRALAAVNALGPIMGCDMQGPIRLAAACCNIGDLVRPDCAGKTVEGIDVTWLLLASWHVPPAALQLIRQRHAPESTEATVLNLAVAWAQTGAISSTDPGGKTIAEFPPGMLEKLGAVDLHIA